MRALWLADVLRDAGLTVHELAGWRTRGADSWGPVRGITCHHTAGSPTSSDAGELNVLINGRPGLSGPIAQLYLSRSGAWYVVASGHCNHNKVGWGGPNEGYGNDALLGIEAQHSGGSEPWLPAQYGSYVRGVAALVRHAAAGWSAPVGHVAGHKEHQPGAKSDPTFNMGSFRSHVSAELLGWDDEMTPQEFLAYDGVPNPYSDAATNPTITVAAALKAGAVADSKVRNEVLPALGRVESDLSRLDAGQTDIADALVAIGDRLTAIEARLPAGN